MRYFLGQPTDLGHVAALNCKTFEELCAQVLLAKPVRLPLTRKAFFALPDKDKTAPNDQQRAKRVRYITPAEFRQTPSPRITERVVRCNLLALDVDDAEDARRLLAQRWDEVLGEYGHLVYHTLRSTKEAPRVRVLVSAEGIRPDKYAAAVRTVAELVGLAKVTRESCVVVQPMYLPTVFQDDPEDHTPIVAFNLKGAAFRAADILPDAESALEDSGAAADARPVSGEIADLEFLRTPIEGVTLEHVASALDALDPDCGMQQWIEIAAGIKHQFSGPEGYELWDTWSAKGKKYVDKEETKYRWDSLKANPTDRAPVTVRSVFRLAQLRGWANPALASQQHVQVLSWIKAPSRSTEELLDQGAKQIAKVSPILSPLEKKTLMVALADTLMRRDMKLPIADIRRTVRQLELDNAKTTGLPAWAKGLVYVTSNNTFYRASTDRRFTPEVLDLMYSVPAIGEEKPMRPRDYCIQIADVPQVEALRYEPARGKTRIYSEGGVPYVNTYRPDYPQPDPARADEAGEVVLDHLGKLIAEPEHRQTLLDWIAYNVQHPGKKIRFAPLIQSGEGAGKGTLFEFCMVVLGRRNTAKVNGKHVMEGQYNDWAYGKQVVCIEEVRIVGHNRHAVMDSMKPLITDDTIGVNQKFEDYRTVPNNTNYILFTNYHDALAIREEGRRYFVLSSPLQMPEHIEAIGGEKHFDRVHAMIRDNAAGLRAFFEQWAISPSFKPEGRAPLTRYLREFAEAAQSPLTAAVKQLLEDGPEALVQEDLLSFQCLRGRLESMRCGDPSDQAIAGVLRELGWTKEGRFSIGGQKHQLWTRRAFANVRETAEQRFEVL